eukprot:353698-Chlamydomonas_euryale.AAC.2
MPVADLLVYCAAPHAVGMCVYYAYSCCLQAPVIVLALHSTLGQFRMACKGLAGISQACDGQSCVAVWLRPGKCAPSRGHGAKALPHFARGKFKVYTQSHTSPHIWPTHANTLIMCSPARRAERAGPPRGRPDS